MVLLLHQSSLGLRWNPFRFGHSHPRQSGTIVPTNAWDWIEQAGDWERGRIGGRRFRRSAGQGVTSDIPPKGHAMTAKLADIQLWQRNLASLIRSGLFTKAEIRRVNALHMIVGVYGDGTTSAPLAKYADIRRAEDSMFLINQLASAPSSVETN